MKGVRFAPAPNRMNNLREHTRNPLHYLARGFAEKMDQNYSFEGSVRSGYINPETGRRVSVRGEFAQEQTGLLRSAISFIEQPQEDGLLYHVGLFTDDSQDPAALREYLQYIEGIKGYIEISASRFGLTRTAESKETHDHMLDHLQANMDPARFQVP